MRPKRRVLAAFDSVRDTAIALTDPAATFLFADIAGFTALTKNHGDEEAATLVADFCDLSVDSDGATGRLMLEGTAHFFCRLACKAASLAGPYAT